MITEYPNGERFLEENRAFLNENPERTTFFFMDSPLLKQADKVNYALKCDNGGKKLLILKVEPYNMLLFGDAECVPESLRFIMERKYELKNYLCATELGDVLLKTLQEQYGLIYEEALAMEFMKADKITEPSSTEVTPAQESDADEIFEDMKRFIADCGLLDKPDREQIRKTIGGFRILKKEGRIVSIAKGVPVREKAEIRISNVYTPDDCRGKGYARKVVNTLKNEILSSGKIASLNVDRNNPVTNHLYRALGFQGVFTQSEYRKK